MNFLKRLVALLVILTMFVSVTSFANEPTDIFSYLSSLGIMIGDETGDFREEDILTRAEFSAIAARLLRIPDIKQAQSFADVPADHWANGYISQIYKMGIINGTGNGLFSPDDPVTYEQAVKILVGVLGYGAEAEKNGGYPAGYLKMGVSLNLNKNLELKGENLLRGEIAQLVYNTLQAYPLTNYGTPDYTKEDRTLGEIISSSMDVVRIEGVVTETHKASLLNTEPSLLKGEATVEGMFIRTNTDLKVGYYAEIYAEEVNGKLNLISVNYPDDNNEIITADAEGAALSGDVFTYYDEEDKEKKQKVNGLTVYMYNGRKTSGFVNINSGSYTLLDNNSDRVADVVYIDEPESFFVNRVNSDNSMIYFDKSVIFRGRNGIKLDFDDETKIISLKGKDGADISVSEIESGNVITIKMSEDSNYIEAIISKDTVEGAIEEVSDDTVIIAGKEYEGAYGGGTNYISNFRLSDSGIFSLDCFGKLVGVQDGNKNTGFIYGYCIDAGTGSGLNSGAMLQVISAADPVKQVDKQGDDEIISYVFQNNDPIVYNLAEKLKFNGSNCSRTDIALNTLPDSLVAMKLNSEGEIKELWYDSTRGRGGTSYTFNAKTMAFGGENVTRGFVTDKNTSYVLVPRSVNSLEDYMVGVTLTDKQETCRVYGTVFFADDKYESAEVQPVNILMIKGEMNSLSAPVTTLTDDVCIVGDVRSATGSIRDDVGSTVYKISLLNGTELKEEVTASFGPAFNVASTLRKGDLIRYKKDGFGRINSISKICSIQGLKNDFSDMIYFTESTETAKFGFVYNTIPDTFDYYTIEFVDKLTLSYMPDGSDTQISYELKIAKDGEVPIYLYNRTTGWIEPGSLDNTLASMYAENSASKAFVLMESSDVKAVVIIED